MAFAYLIEVREGVGLIVTHDGLHQRLTLVEEVHEDGPACHVAGHGKARRAVGGRRAAGVLDDLRARLEVHVPACAAALGC